VSESVLNTQSLTVFISLVRVFAVVREVQKAYNKKVFLTLHSVTVNWHV
jgi:hypothetical protein